MGNLHVWLLIFAGGSIGVLGIYLLASELRNKRWERVKFRADQSGKTLKAPTEAPQAGNHSPAELMKRNKELIEKISSVSRELEESRKAVDGLKTEQARCAGAQAENQRLHEEMVNLRNQLQTTETRLNASAIRDQQAAGLKSKLQAETVKLNQQLQAGQTKLEELESEQQHWSGVRLENQQLRHETTELRNQLQRSEARFSDLARDNQEAADRYARLQNEVIDLRQQLEETQRKTRDMEAVEQQLAEVQSRAMMFKEQQHILEAQIEDLERARCVAGEKAQELHAAGAMDAANERNIERTVKRSARPRWRFGIVPAMIVVVIAVGFAVGALDPSLDIFSGLEEMVAPPGAGFDETPASNDTASQTSRRAGRTSVNPRVKNEVLKQTAATRLRGTFKTTRPTQVYSGPSENSALIASVKSGMKVNVVGSRDGWLEIRSKHGRPPGFIRQEAAEKIDLN
jgi:SH3 domain-containing protein